MDNRTIIMELKKLAEQIKFEITSKQRVEDTFRLKNILFLIKTVESFKKPITKGEDLIGIKGIGEGSRKRIDEIIASGKLDEITLDLEDKKYLKQIEELEQVYGIGRKTAYRFVKNKIKSVEQLKKMYAEKKIDLPYHIVLGLKYHNVYQVTIPRKEIDEINNFIQKVAMNLDKNLIVTICGSYRRKKPFSNDIDILIVHRDIKTKQSLENHNNYLKLFVKELHDNKFLLDDIDKDYEVKYMGFCRYKKHPIRRIDIMYMPYNSLGASLLHFTGSGDFNKKIRETAIRLGFSLSQYGLKNKETNKIIKTITEEDIFSKLMLEYILPEDRD